MNKAVIFDLDGTIIDSRLDLVNSINFMRRHLRLSPLSNDLIMSFIGNGNKNLVQRSLSDFEIDTNKALQIFTTYYINHIVDNTTLYPGAIETFRELLNLNYSLAILSNKNELFSKIICKKLDIEKYFSIIAGGDTFGSLKPDPFGLKTIVTNLNASKEHSWLLGDSHLDLKVAKSFGIKKCFCKYGYGKTENEEYDLIISSLTEFVNHTTLSASHNKGF